MNKLTIIVAAALLAGMTAGCAAFDAPCPLAPIRALGAHPVVVRAEAGALWTAHSTWAEPRKAWAMPARGPVQRVRLHALPGGHGHELLFHQGGVVWRGEIDTTRRPRGPLRALAIVR